MKQRTSCTTYELTFIPRGEDAEVDQAQASEFAEQLHAEFGYSGRIEENPLNDKQYVVYLPIKFESIRKIVVFMEKKGLAERLRNVGG